MRREEGDLLTGWTCRYQNMTSKFHSPSENIIYTDICSVSNQSWNNKNMTLVEWCQNTENLNKGVGDI